MQRDLDGGRSHAVQEELWAIIASLAAHSHILFHFAMCKTHKGLSGGQWGPLCPQTRYCCCSSAIFSPPLWCASSLCVCSQGVAGLSPRKASGDVTGVTRDPRSLFWGTTGCICEPAAMGRTGEDGRGQAIAQWGMTKPWILAKETCRAPLPDFFSHVF